MVEPKPKSKDARAPERPAKRESAPPSARPGEGAFRVFTRPALAPALQRACSCGGTGGSCPACQGQRRWVQSAPREGGRARDSLEAEADRAAQRAVAGTAVGTLSALSPPAPQRQPAGALLVEDATTDVGPGQMRRSEFLAQLREAVCTAAEEALAPTGRSTEGCPYLDSWFAYYASRGPDQIERAIERYAPEAAGAATARDYIAPVVARVRTAVSRWATTGEITGVPPELAAAALGGGALGALGAVVSGVAGAVERAASGVVAGVSGAVSSIVGAVGSIGSLLFKSRGDTPPPDADPQSVRARLGAGRPLDAGVRGSMETAFGRSFADVRVHTDGTATTLADRLGARAFTVGADVAFAGGEYRPGTFTGDALIAHELAHTVQQRGGGLANPSALEADANRAAAGALLLGKGRGPTLRSGLALSRCTNRTAPPAPVPRTETTAFGTYRVVADGTMGPLQADQVTQSQFVQLSRAWRRVNDNSGGLQINGSTADKNSLIAIIGREMGRSPTLRNLIVEITEDAARPVTVNVGRENAYWVDEFGSWNVDLNDMAWYEDIPPAAYPWVRTEGEALVHWLAERRYAVVHGAGYDPSHKYALSAGGPQEQYRAERGQAGRFVTQVATHPSPGLVVGTHTDTAGNQMIFRRDASAGGDPIVYEVEYRPNAPTAVAPGMTRVNNMVARVTTSIVPPAAVPSGPEQLYVRFSGATRSESAPQAAVTMGSTHAYTVQFGRIVPVGGPITVELFRREAAGPDTLLLTISWAHPFGGTNGTATVGGVRYDAAVTLQRSP
jgi:hypothetical protein